MTFLTARLSNHPGYRFHDTIHGLKNAQLSKLIGRNLGAVATLAVDVVRLLRAALRLDKTNKSAGYRQYH